MSFSTDTTQADRGILHVTTKIPMICAIVWGRNTAFGNFNNSLNMNGTGITRHDVYLPGALPGVAYRYEIEGQSASGTLYRSAVGTFEINALKGPSTPQGPLGPDIALGAKVTGYSSEFSPDYAPAKAFDGA